MIRGRSSHDLDLVIYPHSTVGADVRTTQSVFEDLGWIRAVPAERLQLHWRRIGSNDEKHVEVWWIDGDSDRRVDVIYPVSTRSLALRSK